MDDFKWYAITMMVMLLTIGWVANSNNNAMATCLERHSIQTCQETLN